MYHEALYASTIIVVVHSFRSHHVCLHMVFNGPSICADSLRWYCLRRGHPDKTRGVIDRRPVLVSLHELTLTLSPPLAPPRAVTSQ